MSSNYGENTAFAITGDAWAVVDGHGQPLEDGGVYWIARHRTDGWWLAAVFRTDADGWIWETIDLDNPSDASKWGTLDLHIVGERVRIRYPSKTPREFGARVEDPFHSANTPGKDGRAD